MIGFACCFVEQRNTRITKNANVFSYTSCMYNMPKHTMICHIEAQKSSESSNRLRRYERHLYTKHKKKYKIPLTQDCVKSSDNFKLLAYSIHKRLSSRDLAYHAILFVCSQSWAYVVVLWLLCRLTARDA